MITPALLIRMWSCVSLLGESQRGVAVEWVGDEREEFFCAFLHAPQVT